MTLRSVPVHILFNLLSPPPAPWRSTDHRQAGEPVLVRKNCTKTSAMRSKTISLPQLSLLTEDGEERSLEGDIDDLTDDGVGLLSPLAPRLAPTGMSYLKN